LFEKINEQNELKCPVCGNEVLRSIVKITDTNMIFLAQHSEGGTLDEALTILRIICEKVPGITIDVANKSALEEYFKIIQKEIAQMVITPAASFFDNANLVAKRLADLTKQVPKDISDEFLDLKRELAEKLETMERNSETPLAIFKELLEPLGEKLQVLLEKLPTGVREEFREVKIDIQKELLEAKDCAEKSNEGISGQIKELRDIINNLIHKPAELGRFGEGIIAQSWNAEFTQDIVDSKGGPGEPDALVIPYLGMNGGDYGRKISLERKTGSQRYCGRHMEETIRHALKYGASQAILIYDDMTNLPSELRPMKIFFRPSQKLTIAVACLNGKSWATAREIFEVLQVSSPNEEPESIDVNDLDKAIADIQAINTLIDKLRKTNNAAMRNCEGVQTHLEELEELISRYQNRLRRILEKGKVTQKRIANDSLLKAHQ
jgi:methyl-accepting chemotaxis protein